MFVLGTGRCGSVTFARACEHFTNFTVGHESRSMYAHPERLAYSPHHIEVDNRLSWFLGPLGRAFADDDTFYVHLRRDPALVTDSFVRRWDSPFRASIIRAFAYGVVKRRDDWDETDVRSVCETYVTTIVDNVDEFLRSRRSMTIDIDRIDLTFDAFVDAIGAEGDLDAARAEFGVRHNAS